MTSFIRAAEATLINYSRHTQSIGLEDEMSVLSINRRSSGRTTLLLFLVSTAMGGPGCLDVHLGSPRTLGLRDLHLPSGLVTQLNSFVSTWLSDARSVLDLVHHSLWCRVGPNVVACTTSLTYSYPKYLSTIHYCVTHHRNISNNRDCHFTTLLGKAILL